MSDQKEKESTQAKEPGSGPGRRKTVRKGMFAKDLKLLMYGFGDVSNPASDSIAVMDDLVMNYITEMCQEAAKVAESRGKVRVEDFKYVLRKDKKKIGRVEELLYMNDDIRRAKQLFDDKEMDAQDEAP
ncbi:transcription initiation factor IID, 18kD subunit-domain-containing protein [Phascolomyces articulosus]|uniref:Transcription initiation factor TFIID subunit 13 n=1 Tax=Phascolomyces articulosus TaxID=60185 RepID=A0AAD5PC28_9FUNG|nr:transcription initiation factor IID, 18kD subunit-domain-containing protein [Phascolomyces articulosus]